VSLRYGSSETTLREQRTPPKTPSPGRDPGLWAQMISGRSGTARGEVFMVSDDGPRFPANTATANSVQAGHPGRGLGTAQRFGRSSMASLLRWNL
jgi:hypothetical protein